MFRQSLISYKIERFICACFIAAREKHVSEKYIQYMKKYWY